MYTPGTHTIASTVSPHTPALAAGAAAHLAPSAVSRLGWAAWGAGLAWRAQLFIVAHVGASGSMNSSRRVSGVDVSPPKVSGVGVCASCG